MTPAPTVTVPAPWTTLIGPYVRERAALRSGAVVIAFIRLMLSSRPVVVE